MPGSSDLGISTGGLADGPARRAVECLLAIAFYNFVELVVIIQTAFKRRQGLYYWSFVVATWGIAIYAVGFLTKDLSLIRNGAVYGTFIVVGWTCMVTGQSMVLWSRMHLLVRNKRTLRAILGLIVVDALVGHVPTSVVLYGSNSPHPERWLDPYAILERCHVTLFFLQELAISTIYIVETTKLLRTKPSMPGPPMLPTPGGGGGGGLGEEGGRGGGGGGGQQRRGKGGRRRQRSMGSMSSRDRAAASSRQFLRRLIYINVLVVVLDITIVALEYAGLYVIQTAYKALVYSVKLKLEFSILNSLVEMTRAQRYARDGMPPPHDDAAASSSVSSCTPPLSGCCSSRDTILASADGSGLMKGGGGHGGNNNNNSNNNNNKRRSMMMTMMTANPLTRQDDGGGGMHTTATPMTFSRLTQTIDEDGQIRYNNDTTATASGQSRRGSSHSRIDDGVGGQDGGGNLPASLLLHHSRPESAYYPPTSTQQPSCDHHHHHHHHRCCCSLHDVEGSMAMADAAAASQFVIRRDRREDWEDKSDLDELVLQGGIQSIMTE